MDQHEFISEVCALADADLDGEWRGTFDELRAAISARRNLSTRQLVTAIQCLIPEFVRYGYLPQDGSGYMFKVGSGFSIRNIDRCFGLLEPKNITTGERHDG